MGQLDGKRALITGGTTGIGFATAALFRQEGAKIAITGLNPERLAAAKAALGDALAIEADAADRQSGKRAVEETAQAFGGIDILFLNAGIAHFVDLANITEEFFDNIFNVNVKGVLFTAQAALPYLKKGASIIVTTSIAGHLGTPGGLVYGASKAAARSMVRVLASELAPLGVRANAICPGPIETPIYGKMNMPAEQVQAVAEQFAQKVPLKHFGKPEDIAQAALYLASDHSSFVTGTEIVVDGGWIGVG